LLGIAPLAVSQYILRKRGYKIEYKGDKKELIEKLAKDLIDNKIDDFVTSIYKIYIKARGIKSNCNSSFGLEELHNNAGSLKNKGSFQSNTPTACLKVETS
jgi:hypothetical protein